NSLIGIILGLLGLLTGGNFKLHSGVAEFSGGLIRPLFDRLGSGVMAMTLGHCVLGIDENALHITRKHERVHVRQYERWGPLFIPAYFLCSAILWMQKKDCYRLNPFEVEAFRVSDPNESPN
ncbi:MAG: hypothetical protein AAF623_20480, partial [Planctomycetota bacterium]